LTQNNRERYPQGVDNVDYQLYPTNGMALQSLIVEPDFTDFSARPAKSEIFHPLASFPELDAATNHFHLKIVPIKTQIVFRLPPKIIRITE
jgi:hypothetical protein